MCPKCREAICYGYNFAAEDCGGYVLYFYRCLCCGHEWRERIEDRLNWIGMESEGVDGGALEFYDLYYAERTGRVYKYEGCNPMVHIPITPARQNLIDRFLGNVQ